MSRPQRSTARESGGCVFRAAPVAPGWLLAALCCTWMCGAVLAAPLPEKVPEHSFVRVSLEENQQAFILLVKDNRFHPVEIIETKSGLAFTGPPGHYAVLITGGGNSLPQYVEIEAKTPPFPPKPDDSKPPGPEPPKPDPKPVPIAMEGLRVLFVYESATLSALPPAQRAILQSTRLMDWMNRNCHKVDSRPEWRMTDQNTPVAFATPFFVAAVNRQRSAVPWLLINNGTKGTSYDGPLPATVDETLALLEANR